MRFLLLGLILSLSAFADVVVSGHSSSYCSTQILSQKEFVYETTPNGVEAPQTCEDFSGDWVGGCYGAVLPGASADNIDLDNLRVTGQLSDAPLTVVQDGCRVVKVGVITLDVSTQTTGQAHTNFRRSCTISGSSHASWERTFDMSLYIVGTRGWNGTRLQFENDLRGADPNYKASYRQVRHWRVYHPNGDPEQLRVDFGYFENQKNYDPAAFEFYSPSFGGQVCVWRKR